jgi:hypothetical protein
MTSGPVGLAETNSRRTRRPAAAVPRPYARPASRTPRSAFAHQAGARKTLRNPGPAISTRSTSGIGGKWRTIASAIWRGGFLAARASCIATFVA